jgi:hypothetical protein
MNDLFTHMETAPTVTAPSIASSAMFAELSIGNWTARKLDRKATKETTSANGASDDAGSFHKKLLSSPELDAIQKHIANTRQNVHYRLTMPWSDLGVRLLPTAMFADYYRGHPFIHVPDVLPAHQRCRVDRAPQRSSPISLDLAASIRAWRSLRRSSC